MRISTVLASGAVLVALATSSASAQIVTNGDFETGDFTGWSLTGNTGFTGVVGSPYAHSGSFGGAFGAIGSPTIFSQTIATTAGQSYDFSFWLYNDGGTPNSFFALFDNTVVMSLIDTPGQAFTQYTFTHVASTNSTPIEFDIQQDPAYFGLDDISVTATNQSVTPEPATMGLLATGLVGMAGFSRRRKAAA